MSEEQEPTTQELKQQQSERAREERRRAEEADLEAETRAHARRADKSAYLREKLAEREESERE